MKKNFVFAGLVAVGAAGLQTACAESLDLISPKCWNVSATLRGFYDDNYNVTGNGRGSAGAELSPSISFNMPMQQTDIGLRYTYGLYYYQDRQDLNLNAFDQTHQLDVWVDHAFNERWKANVSDTLAVGQEPDLIGTTTGGNAVQYRVQGDNLANHGTAKLDTEWTRLFSTSLQYGNNFYDYQQSGGNVVNPSLAGLLNRVEQSGALDLEWHVQPDTMVFVGYKIAWADYIGDEPIAINPVSLKVYQSSDRNSLSHYGYVGVRHDFTANLSGKISGGATYTDSYNQNSTSWSPYADMSVSYTYIPGSYVQLGFTHDLNATDVRSVNASGMTQYAESSVGYASINHQITTDLVATLIGRCQYSTYVGGAANNANSTTYDLGFNLHYQFNRHFSADLGYNYDHLLSDSNLTGREYERNRVYLGLGVNY